MFKDATCPKCHEKIQVPDDKEKVICMFCGQEILVAEALPKTAADPAHYEECRQKALEELALLMKECDNPMKDFKRNLYADKFEEFYAEHRKMLDAMEYVYADAEDPKGWLEEMSDHLIGAAKERMEQCKVKMKKSQLQIDCNFMVSIYLIPSVLKRHGDFSEPFADCLLERWNQAFGTTIGKATVEAINGGFRRKLCYITTAVCESLGKDADCYELRLLKNYRDQYLDQTEEGHEMVQDYYDIAPTIVKRMNRETDCELLYQMLYRQYIGPCIQKIEDGEYESCRELYREMVLDLKEKYMN